MNVSTTSYDFSLNSHPVIQLLSIGNEQKPVVVVDGLLEYPEQLLEYAEQGVAFQSNPTDYYPGIRKTIAGAYSQLLCASIQKSFPDIFGLNEQSASEVGLCALSLATTVPDKLRPIQSLPHFDNSNPLQLAVAHFLCGSEHGGTSFYRHRQTGYESITPERVQSYATTLKEQVVKAQFSGRQYMSGDNDWFERIISVEAKFNRAIFFQGNLLHSGDINSDKGLSGDPKTGRLMANTFINFANV